MNPAIGQYLLGVNCLIALAQVIIIPRLSSDKQGARWSAVSMLMQLFFVITSFIFLIYAYVISDFSLMNVALNSHSTKPLMYKIAGVWSNHEGSMLLWLLILVSYGAAFAYLNPRINLRLYCRTLSVMSLLSLGFHLFLLLTSNPFYQFDVPLHDGRGLNPILQDPALTFHPPLLYLGYVGFSLPFSITLASLIEGNLTLKIWPQLMRFWTLIPWAFLTLGITAGSWWAYYELGWGGWWFWDPVENASLLPWLTSTALLHSLIVTEKRQNLLRWSAFLSILTFFFSLSGTFLVRSGLLTSVHSFAADPSRGILIFLMIVLVMTYAFWHFFVRFRSLATTGVFAPLSKESSIVFNNVMLCSIAGTVFLGTIYPLILDMFNGPQVSVGAPYFQATVVPMVAPLTILMGVGPLLRWKQSDLRALFSRLQFALTAACAAILLTWYLQEKGPTLVIGAVGLAVWLIVATLINWYKTIFPQKDIRSHFFQRIFRIPINSHGMSIAHLGSALLILGMCLDVLGGQEKIQLMGIGDKIKLSHYQLTLADVKQVRGPNYHAEQASIKVAYRGKEFAQLHPERRFYPVEKSVTTDVALLTVGVSDLYGVLGDFHRNGQWTTRFYYHPFVDLIWIGAIFMAFGGGLAAWGRRKI